MCIQRVCKLDGVDLCRLALSEVRSKLIWPQVRRLLRLWLYGMSCMQDEMQHAPGPEVAAGDLPQSVQLLV